MVQTGTIIKIHIQTMVKDKTMETVKVITGDKIRALIQIRVGIKVLRGTTRVLDKNKIMATAVVGTRPLVITQILLIRGSIKPLWKQWHQGNMHPLCL